MPQDRCCCCHLMTAAAIVGVLQLLIVVFEMSTSGLILAKWEEWHKCWEQAEHGMMGNKLEHNELILKKLQIYEKLDLKAGTNITSQDYMDLRTLMDDEMAHIRMYARKINERNEMIRNGTVNATLAEMEKKKDDVEKENKEELVSDASQQLFHTYVVGFTAIWALALLVYAGAFYYRRASLVLPNFIITIVALIALFLIIVNMIVMVAYEKKEKDKNKIKEMLDMDKKDDEMYEMFKHMFVSTMVVTIIMWIVLIVFAVIIHKFHKWLIMGHGMMVFPELPTVHHPIKPSSAAFDS